MDNGKIQTFRDQLTRLLAKYCDEPTVQNIGSKLKLIRDSEEDLMAQARRDAEPEGGKDLVEEGLVYQIIAETQLLLPKKEFLGILTEISNLCVDFGQYSTAEALFSNAIEAANDGVRFFNQAAEALQKRADVLLRQASWERAKMDLRESRRLFTRTKNELGIGKIENSLGIFMAQQGNTKESVAHFKKAVSLFEKAKRTDLASTAYMNMGIVATIIGKYDEALASYKRALPEFERAGDVQSLAELHHNLGMLFLARAELDSALGQFDESLNYANQVHYDALIGMASLGKAAAYVQKKDFVLAHLFGNKALSIFRRLSAYLSIADSYKVKGIIQRELKHYDTAELYFQSSISLNKGYHNPLNLGEAYLEIGLLHKECGDKAKAKEVFQKSLKCFQQVGAKHNIVQVRALLGSLKS